MSDDLLQNARQQASKARPSLRASALMRTARAESTTNAAQARTSLQEALAIICDLPSPNNEHQFEEARAVAAAVDPALLAEIQADSFGMPPQHSTFQIVQVMLAHGHVHPAFDYVLSYEGSDSFPFAIIGDVLQKLDPKLPDLADRRLRLLRAAAETWRQRSSDEGVFGRDSFVRLFGHFWKEIPPEEAIANHANNRSESDRGTRHPDVVQLRRRGPLQVVPTEHVIPHAARLAFLRSRTVRCADRLPP